MIVSIETGRELEQKFKAELEALGFVCWTTLTGSVAINGCGEDVDVLVEVSPEQHADFLEYISGEFQNCNGGSYEIGAERSVWRRGDLNVIWTHTTKEYANWQRALLLCLYVAQLGVSVPKELRVAIHKGCRGEYFA